MQELDSTIDQQSSESDSHQSLEQQGIGSVDDEREEVRSELSCESTQAEIGEGAQAGEEAGKNEDPKKMEIFVSPPVKVRDFDDVRRAVEDHASWIESVVNPRCDIRAGRANFKGSDLSGYNLAGVDLRGATFTNCICRGTIFTGANLAGAQFKGADLSGADFRGAKLKRANFDHAILIGADWDDAQLDQASFRYAKRDDDAVSPEVVTEDLDDASQVSIAASEESMRAEGVPSEHEELSERIDSDAEAVAMESSSIESFSEGMEYEVEGSA